MIAALWPRTSPAMRSMRRFISTAARREKVINRMRRGSAPARIRWATRCASVLVLPVPAPAMTSSGPATCAVTVQDRRALGLVQPVEIAGVGAGGTGDHIHPEIISCSPFVLKQIRTGIASQFATEL